MTRLLLLLIVLLAPARAMALDIPGPARLLQDLVAKVTGGGVIVQGASGWPNALHFDRIELRDDQGAWLIAEDVSLDWHPYLLVRKQASIDKVTVARLEMPRLRAASTAPPQTD